MITPVTSINTFLSAPLHEAEEIRGISSMINDEVEKIACDALLNIKEGSPKDSFINPNVEGPSFVETFLIVWTNL